MIRLSAEWSQVEAPEGVEVAVALTSWRPSGAVVDYRPNVNLVAGPVTDDVPDVLALGTEAVAAATVTAEEVHVISYGRWESPGGPPGRRLTFAYRHGEAGIYVSQWMFALDGVLSTVTGSCGADLASTLDPYFRYFAATVELPVLEGI